MTLNREFRIDNEYAYYCTGGPARWILSHILRYPLIPIGTIIGSIFQNLSYSYIQIAIGIAFDMIMTPAWTSPQLLQAALMLIVFGVGATISGIIRNLSTVLLSQCLERDTREELYTSLLGKSQTFHGRQRIGDIMARATNDVRALTQMISPGFMLIVDSIMTALVPMVVIALLNPLLLLTPLIFLIFFYFTIKDYNRKLNPVSTEMRTRFGEMNAGLAEAIAGIQVIKANAWEKGQWSKFVRDAAVVRDLFVRQGEIQACYLPILMFFILRGLAFLHALFLWHLDEISIGQAVAFMGLINALRFSTYISSFSFNLLQLGLAGAGRILELINCETELDENPRGHAAAISGEVVFEKVCFHYPLAYDEIKSKPILNKISFKVKPGETVAIVGHTGSGKTTLTRLINRIYDADSGQVIIDGITVDKWCLDSLRSQISFIEQDVFLFSQTIFENIAFGQPRADRTAVENAARAAQAHEFIMQFVQGYQTKIGERGVTLSGGQRQRVAIARAFLSDPRILILDDSTSAVDSATEDRIQQAMRQISRNRTTFLITHRLSQIRWADRILVLKKGNIQAHGTHAELMQTSQDYQRIFSKHA